jgi:hypothetical protein
MRQSVTATNAEFEWCVIDAANAASFLNATHLMAALGKRPRQQSISELDRLAEEVVIARNDPLHARGDLCCCVVLVTAHRARF